MAIVTLQLPPLSAAQKKRIGDRLISALHQEDIAPSSVVVIFQTERDDIYLDGGLLHEAGRAVVMERPQAAPTPYVSAPTPASDDFKTRPRRTKAELADLKRELCRHLQSSGSLSSFEAQEKLGLKECDWAPATLRRFFKELEEEGAITKTGKKRGTRYAWKGMVSAPQPIAMPLLVKKPEIEG